ncbi:MAG TPA: Wzz/FepE/Etk N-terminal domain-containing protein [Terriglobales bacterium]|nr:Wzz/FepE/Etk N-terminal domain-containing protein [Terriglobales bacterium]
MTTNYTFVGRQWTRGRQQTLWWILIPAILGSLSGLVLSYAFPTRYTSQALVLVEQRNASLANSQETAQDQSYHALDLQSLLTRGRAEPVIQPNDLTGTNKTPEHTNGRILQNARVYPARGDLSQYEISGEKSAGPLDISAFYLEYTSSSPAEAQQICNQLTSILLQQNLQSWQASTETLAESLRQTDDAKRNVDEQRAKLASFKKGRIARLTAEGEDDESTLEDLRAKLKRINQTINTAQQDQSHVQSLLAQQPTKSANLAPIAVDRPRLEKRLSDLQSQLMQLRAEYTDDHPDVVKTKADMAAVERELSAPDDQNASPGPNSTMGDRAELNSRLEHDKAVIADSKREQNPIQEEIKSLRHNLSRSTLAESKYKQVKRDYDAAQKSYVELSSKNSDLDHALDAGAAQHSPMIRLLRPANRPIKPSFPNRLLFALSGWLCFAFVARFAPIRLPPASSHPQLRSTSRPERSLNNQFL